MNLSRLNPLKNTICRLQQKQCRIVSFSSLQSQQSSSQVVVGKQQRHRQYSTDSEPAKRFRNGHRKYSTDCEPAKRFRDALEEYRKENCSKKTPSRFKKEVLRVFKKRNSAGEEIVEVDCLNQILINIGRPEATFTEEELHVLLQEIGCGTTITCTETSVEENHYIPASRIIRML